MPPRIKPSLQQRQRRQTRKRPSPDRTSAPPVEGHGNDHAVNDDADDALHDEIAKLREERDFLRQTCASVVSQASGFQKALERIIADQDRTIADLKAALEAEKTHRRALQSQLQNPRLHQWLNEDHASTPFSEHGEHHSIDGDDAPTAFPFWQPVLTSADAALARTQSIIDSPPRM